MKGLEVMPKLFIKAQDLEDYDSVKVFDERGKEVYYKAAETPLVWKLHTTIEDVAEIRCPQ